MPGAIAFLKEPRIYEGEEFKALPVDTREYLTSPTVPQIEILTHFPVRFLIPQFSGLDYSCLGIILMNAQSRGEVVLRSSDTKAPLLFDPKLHSHPFDRKAHDLFGLLLMLRIAMRI